MAARNATRVHASVRFQSSTQSRFGMVLLHVQDHHIDLRREAELLLEARFLPFAIRRAENLSLAVEVAYDCVSRLEGMARMIREFYQLAPAPGDMQAGIPHAQSDEGSVEVSAVFPLEIKEPEPPTIQVERGGQLFGESSN
jgi:hypothetical protein